MELLAPYPLSRPLDQPHKSFGFSMFGDLPALLRIPIYSLVETASANGWNPIDYLCQAFEGLTTAKSPEDVKALLPWNMSKSKLAE